MENVSFGGFLIEFTPLSSSILLSSTRTSSNFTAAVLRFYGASDTLRRARLTPIFVIPEVELKYSV